VSLDELAKLEEKLDTLVSLINELKQKVEDLEEHNSTFKSREKEIKEKVEFLIGKIDNLLI
jgi:FtsZ-binding cell division protein ZapB